MGQLRWRDTRYQHRKNNHTYQRSDEFSNENTHQSTYIFSRWRESLINRLICNVAHDVMFWMCTVEHGRRYTFVEDGEFDGLKWLCHGWKERGAHCVYLTRRWCSSAVWWMSVDWSSSLTCVMNERDRLSTRSQKFCLWSGLVTRSWAVNKNSLSQKGILSQRRRSAHHRTTQVHVCSTRDVHDGWHYAIRSYDVILSEQWRRLLTLLETFGAPLFGFWLYAYQWHLSLQCCENRYVCLHQSTHNVYNSQSVFIQAPQLINTRYVNVKVFEVANGNCSSTNAVISILNDTSPWQEWLVHNDGNIEAYTALVWWLMVQDVGMKVLSRLETARIFRYRSGLSATALLWTNNAHSWLSTWHGGMIWSYGVTTVESIRFITDRSESVLREWYWPWLLGASSALTTFLCSGAWCDSRHFCQQFVKRVGLFTESFKQAV